MPPPAIYDAVARARLAAALGCDADAPAVDEVEQAAKLYRFEREAVDPLADPRRAARDQLLAVARLAGDLSQALDGLGMMARSRLLMSGQPLAEVHEHCAVLAPAAEDAAASIKPLPSRRSPPTKLARAAFIRRLRAIYKRTTGRPAASGDRACVDLVVTAFAVFPDEWSRSDLRMAIAKEAKAASK